MNKNMSEFMELLEHYFTVYLPSSVGVSPNTITSYKYAFKLLLRFLGEKYSLAPDRITFADLNYETITNFLEWLVLVVFLLETSDWLRYLHFLHMPKAAVLMRPVASARTLIKSLQKSRVNQPEQRFP